MFDALLKSKFYSKSKSKIKTTKKRIEVLTMRRTAMEKNLRNDVAELLKNYHDDHAYTRVEWLHADQNLISCYEFVQQLCLLILRHLSAMDKSRECPEECKEAVSTLMYAAARFGDLPELYKLRSLFAERYGNVLEPYVNQEFVKNLKSDPPSKEIKLQIMQEIAKKCGIQWDSKALEQKPPPFVKDLSQPGNERNNEPCKPHQQNDLETNAQETEKKYWSSNSSSCSDSTASQGDITDLDDSASEDIVGRKFSMGINGGREVPAPARTGSLPAESIAASEEREGLATATTCSSGMGRPGHVHPKLPDHYDDLVARLAALRAGS